MDQNLCLLLVLTSGGVDKEVGQFLVVVRPSKCTYAVIQHVGKACAAYWRTKEDFARDGVPKIFFDMFPNYGTISQGGWDERKTFEYLYATGTEEGVFGCLARFHQGFFAYGFTVDDAGVLPEKQKQTG